jgi:hypothetical protein
MQSTPAN